MSASLDLIEVWKKQPLMRILAGMILVLMGILFSKIPAMIKNQSWPSTGGVVISRRIVANRFKEYDGDYYTVFRCYIRYEYQVDGITYSSLTVNAIDTPSYPYETAQRYPEGKEVQVFYDPRDPSRAVLEPGWVLSRQAVGFFPTVFSITGFYLLVREGWLKFRSGKRLPEGSSVNTYTKGRPTMNESSSSRERGPRWARLVARIWSVPLIIIAAFITIGNIWASLTNAPPDPYAVENATFLETLPPILLGVGILGLALGWRWEKWGGIFALVFGAGAVVVLLIERSGSGDLSRDLIPYLLTLAVIIPGILFLIYGFRAKPEG